MSTPEKILYSIFYKINSTDKNYSLESIKLTQETTIEQLKESILDILKDKLKKDNLYDIYFNSNESNEGILLNDSTDKLTVGELDKQLADKKIKNKDSIFILPQNKSVNESNSEDPDFVTAQEPPQTDEENKTVIVTPEQEQEQEQEQDKEKTGVPEGTVGIVTPEQEKTASLEKENTVPLEKEKTASLDQEKENTVQLEKENTVQLEKEKENTVQLEKENTVPLDQEKENTAASLDQEKENTVPLDQENTAVS
jgi:hypothetical protein